MARGFTRKREVAKSVKEAEADISGLKQAIRFRETEWRSVAYRVHCVSAKINKTQIANIVSTFKNAVEQYNQSVIQLNIGYGTDYKILSRQAVDFYRAKKRNKRRKPRTDIVLGFCSILKLSGKYYVRV